MMAGPGIPAGHREDALVETVDIFPTVVEAATGTRLPACPADVHLSRETDACTEGFSLMPLLQGKSAGRAFAVSQYPRSAPKEGSKGKHKYMGYTMRYDTYRYTEWVLFDFDTATADWSEGGFAGRELYNHTGAARVPLGTWEFESVNEAEDPANAALVQQLHAKLVKCAQRPQLCV